VSTRSHELNAARDGLNILCAIHIRQADLPMSETFKKGYCLGSAVDFAASGLLDIIVEHPFLAGLVEIDGQFVAVDRCDIAIAEFDMKHTVANKARGGFPRYNK
jgi:hypothetical protein